MLAFEIIHMLDKYKKISGKYISIDVEFRQYKDERGARYSIYIDEKLHMFNTLKQLKDFFECHSTLIKQTQ